MKILISACLLGVHCRYDGNVAERREIEALVRTLTIEHTLIPICPEQLGGLPTPRTPAEIMPDGRVVTRDGVDVTAEYQRGADEVMMIAKKLGCDAAILKERSPSCGVGRIYDGSFSGKLVEGDGITAAKLRGLGLELYGESDAVWLAAKVQEKSARNYHIFGS